MKSALYDLFASSAILTGLIAVLLIGTVCYMLIMGIPIPPLLESLVTLVVGYFFGNKTSAAVAQAKSK